MKHILAEEYIEKKDLKAFIEKDKTLEKKVKAIVADVINDLFKILWQRRTFYDSQLRH